MKLLSKITVVAFLLMVLVGCGDDGTGSTGGGGSGATNPSVVTPADSPVQRNTTVTFESQGSIGATVTPDATATRIIGTATNEASGNTQRATVTPNNDDMPLGGN